MTGRLLISAALVAAPSMWWRITIMSAYPETILIVSESVSPFFVEVTFSSENPITFPPVFCTAVSKLSLVLVDGSKKRDATVFPARIFFFLALFIFSISAAFDSTASMSFLEKSLMETTSVRPNL